MSRCGIFVRMVDDLLIARYASRQHGVFNYRQVREAGFDKFAASRRIKTGSWLRLDYTVFCLPSAPASWKRQMSAALLSRDRAVAGSTSAAYLHGLRGFRSQRPAIVVPGSANARSKLARVIRSEHFDELDTVSIDRLRVTSTSETVLSLASILRPPRLGEVFDDCLLSGKLDLEKMKEVVDREAGRRRKGIVALRDLIADRSPNTPGVESTYLEGMLEMMLGRISMPPWTREHQILLGDDRFRVDVFVPAWSLVIEADGRTWHMLKEAFETDRQRDNSLAARGIQVLRFTYRMLRNDLEGCQAAVLETGLVRSA